MGSWGFNTLILGDIIQFKALPKQIFKIKKQSLPKPNYITYKVIALLKSVTKQEYLPLFLFFIAFWRLTRLEN